MKALMISAMLLLAQGLAAQSDAKGILDGESFTILVWPAGSEEMAEEDLLIFRDGIVYSEECEKWGFDRAEYEASTTKKGTKFTFTMYSKDEGSATWTGTVVDGKVEGEYNWLREDDDEVIYEFTSKE